MDKQSQQVDGSVTDVPVVPIVEAGTSSIIAVGWSRFEPTRVQILLINDLRIG